MLKRTPLKRKTPLRTKTIFDNTEVKVKKPCEDRAKHIKELDAVFQYYIRLRDSKPNGICQCISCGKYVPFAKIQAGHFRSRMHMSTRWNEMNVNGECETCNLELRNGDHLLDYRRNLVKKIGKKKVEWIEGYCNTPVKWCDFEIVLMIKDYCKKCKSLSEEKGISLSKTVQRIIKKYETASITRCDDGR
ncbi:MAG: recombination protein NinG [Prevotella sp.]|nr:recombination protein NinG [Prevotella sp.]